MKREVYITGLGIVSPIGVGQEKFLASIRSGRCGLGELHTLDTTGFRIGRGGEVKSGGATDEGRCFAFALRACEEALADSGLRGEDLPANASIALGSGAGEMRATELTMGPPEEALLLDHPDPIQTPICIASKLGLRLGLHGRQLAFTNACAAGAQAIAVASDLVRHERADLAIAGGVEVLSRMVMSGFEALRAVSPTGCHPFDVERDGIQLSELAAFVVLESGERLKRGVRPYARVSGSGASADAFHVVRPDGHGTGAELAIRRALADAGLGPDEIDYVNAHGTGTVQNDPVELAALARVFGERAKRMPISSTKAMLGHALGASGAAEVVICALALRHRFVPPTIALRQPLSGYEDFDFVRDVVRDGVGLAHVASTAFAFGGNNIVLVLSDPDEGAERRS
jgi:3-oxoacyl-[acyl-carrier-protein] synthase II